MVLRIDTDEEDFAVTGAMRFFLVRGDSALIPEDLAKRGVGADPNRWYIERWEDETVGEAATRQEEGEPQPTPSRNTTLCGIKVLYR